MSWNRISFFTAVLIVVIFFAALIASVSQAHWFDNDDPRFADCSILAYGDDTLTPRQQRSVYRQCVWEFHPHGKNSPR